MERVSASGIGKLLAVLLVGVGCGCGGGQSGSTPPPPPPAITLGVLVPSYTVAGGGAVSLSLGGTGFTNSSVVQWNGTALPTTFGTAEILTATVASDLVAIPGTASIMVKDPSSGAASNPQSFGIASPAAATAGVIQLVTVGTDGSPANGNSLVGPSINSDGRYVAFQSAATNLVSGPASGYQDIYLRDTCLGASAPPNCTPSTIRISVTYDGSPTNGHSRDSSVSGDGRFVAFDSQATDILPNTSICSNICVFLRDTCNGAAAGCVPTTTLISAATDGTAVTGSSPWISLGEEFIAFASGATNIVTGGASGLGDVYVLDTCIGAPAGCIPGNTLASVPSAGGQGNAVSYVPTISSTGRFVAFESWATNMSPNGAVAPGGYWRDTCIGATPPCTPSTIRIDLTAGGSQPNGSAFTAIPLPITADGRLVAFGSAATNLVSQNVNGKGNVYVRDTCTGAPAGCVPTTSLASLANDGSVANCGSPSQGVSMSSDGRFVAFDSIATNLVPGDGFPACSFEDVFVRDTCFGVAAGCIPSTVRVSVTNQPNPETPGFAISGYPAISGDGHYIVFLSAATNFFPGTNGNQMVFLAKTGF